MRVIVLIQTLFLAGCAGGFGADLTAPTLQPQLLSRLPLGIGAKAKTDDPAITRASLTPQVLQQAGGKALMATLPATGAQMVFYPSALNGDYQTWITTDRVTLTTRRGLVTSTRGLGQDLMSADIGEPVALVTGAASADTAVRVHRTLDGERQTVIDSFVCRYTPRSSPGGRARVIEICRGLPQYFSNAYTLDADGNVTTSRQWLGEGLGYIDLETVNSNDTAARKRAISQHIPLKPTTIRLP